MKTCATCGESKPLAEFYNDKRRKIGSFVNCKSCMRISAKHYREAKRETLRIRQKAWRKAHLEQCRTWERVHSRKMKRKVNPRYHAWRTTYCNVHAEKGAEYTRKRRALKLGVSVGDQPIRISVVAKRDKHKCYLCGKRLKKADRTLDHVIPLSKGGAHSYANVLLCCSHCNKSKGARDLGEHIRIKNMEALNGTQLQLVPPQVGSR